jgi:hypothetical protein
LLRKNVHYFLICLKPEFLKGMVRKLNELSGDEEFVKFVTKHPFQTQSKLKRKENVRFDESKNKVRLIQSLESIHQAEALDSKHADEALQLKSSSKMKHVAPPPEMTYSKERFQYGDPSRHHDSSRNHYYGSRRSERHPEIRREQPTYHHHYWTSNGSQMKASYADIAKKTSIFEKIKNGVKNTMKMFD